MATGDPVIAYQLYKSEAELNSSVLSQSEAIWSLAADDCAVLLLSPEKKALLLAYHHWSAGLSPREVLAHYDDFLHGLPFRLDHAARTTAIFSQSGFTLVPEELFHQGEGALILSYTTKLEKNDRVFSEALDPAEAVLLYRLPELYFNWFQKRFAQGRLMHQGNALYQLYRQYNRSDTFTHLHVERNQADLFLARQGKVLFYNRYAYQTEEDLVYYLLYALEQNRVLATEIEVFLSGLALKGEKLYELLSRYLGEVRELPLTNRLQLGAKIAPREIRRHINLLATL